MMNRNNMNPAQTQTLRWPGHGTIVTVTAIITALALLAWHGTAVATAFVPHDLNGVTEPVMLSAFENAGTTRLSWAELPGAVVYNAIRGTTLNLHDGGEGYVLGPLLCLGSLPPTTTEISDGGLPPSPGEAFFYLVEYDDGLRSGYGTESAAKERMTSPADGSCP